MSWKTVDRPGQTGFKKDQVIRELNLKYGEGNWRKAWIYNENELTQHAVFLLCEDAYFADAMKRPEVWKVLCLEARDVYDILPEEVESGLDYSKQHKFTRFHDIAIRRVIERMGWNFQGKKLIQIRFDKDNTNWFSENFDPGKVLFHNPDKILSPRIEGWWEKNSIEDFYQSNKVLQVKESALNKKN